VHKARGLDGSELACKLQYPDMDSAVSADLAQLDLIFAVHRRMDPAIDTRNIAVEIGARLHEELDYVREAKHMRLYAEMLAAVPEVRVPAVYGELSTRRLLTMEWLEGRSILDYVDADLDSRNRLATAMYRAWWHPFGHFGVIHGDPHLGNYTVFETDGVPQGINLLDYGCVRIFPPRFVQGVVDLYHGLQHGDRALIVHAYETWGFTGLSKELIDALNIWAGFIYGPLLDDRLRTIADGVKPGDYGRREAFRVHKVLKEKGPVTVPREFVFMDRAAIGLGGVLLHLKAELNFHRLFEAEIAQFDLASVEAAQRGALARAELEMPD
jgi:predicted unusual protein kinase regulating ubiquinone biosynthesis (AarF/ABC1/UbiB family)